MAIAIPHNGAWEYKTLEEALLFTNGGSVRFYLGHEEPARAVLDVLSVGVLTVFIYSVENGELQTTCGPYVIPSNGMRIWLEVSWR